VGACARAGQQSLDARSGGEAARRPQGLPRLDTAPSRALHALLDQLRSDRGAYMSLRIARRSGPPSERRPYDLVPLVIVIAAHTSAPWSSAQVYPHEYLL